MLLILSLRIFIWRRKVVVANSLELGFANCGTRAITVTLTAVYWYAALKTSKYKKDKFFKSK
jgi:hypothetical protein